MSDAIRHDPSRRPPAPQLPARGRDAARPSAADDDARLRADVQALEGTLARLEHDAAVREHSGDARDQDSSGGRQSREQQAGAAADDAASLAPAIDRGLVRLGHFVTHVHQAAHGQGSWSLSLPLDEELLPDTVLHLGYAPALVTLHFDTRDWTARELLSGRLAALEDLVRQLLPPGCDVVVSI